MPRDPDLHIVEERWKDDVAHCQSLFWNCILNLDGRIFEPAVLFHSLMRTSSCDTEHHSLSGLRMRLFNQAKDAGEPGFGSRLNTARPTPDDEKNMANAVKGNLKEIRRALIPGLSLRKLTFYSTTPSTSGTSCLTAGSGKGEPQAPREPK